MMMEPVVSLNAEKDKTEELPSKGMFVPKSPKQLAPPIVSDGTFSEVNKLIAIVRESSQSNVHEVLDFCIHEAVHQPVTSSERLWYKEAVFYEVYVRAFCDSNGDGYGDLAGLTSRLDYLSTLGVNCVWLLPIYPSPLKDDGYDVADYVNIHPDYGTLEDFKTLVKAVHERNMRIIADYIPNHCSDQHEWFQKARADKNSPYRDYFVWSKDPTKYKEARIIFLDTEPSNWTWDEVAGEYYWHRFFSSQPDLNYENPKVVEEMLSTMRFWLNLGIDGFRVDAVPYLFEEEGTNCENLPQTHKLLKRMRQMIEEEFPGRILLAEACQLPQQVREYFGDGDEFHLGFHFPVMPRIYMSIKAEDATSLREVLRETPDIPENCQWVTFLRNHDELTLEMVTPAQREWMWQEYAPEKRMRINLGIRRRLAPLLDNDRRKIELAHSMLLTLPGSPILYYGDEILMGDNIYLPDRNGVRTPMQWDETKPHAGFSTAKKIYTPIVQSKEYGPDRVNVKDAMKDPSSFYNALRHMIAIRRQHPSFGWGKLFWIATDNPSISAWVRYYGEDKVLVVSNICSRKQRTVIKLPNKLIPQLGCAIDILNGAEYTIKHSTLEFVLEPYQFLWLDVGIDTTVPGAFHKL